MIKYSPRAAKALGYLKKTYNCVEVFVEDTSSQSVWIRIINSILPDNCKVRSVNMLGGRENVLKACRLDQEDDGRKKLYIVDADLDFLRGIKKPRLKFLYRLRAYCVENLLLSERSLVEVAIDSDPNLNAVTAKSAIDYSNKIDGFSDSLKALFAIYATANELGIKTKTVSFSVTNLLESDAHAVTLSHDKMRNRCFELLREMCRRRSVREVRKIRKKCYERTSSLTLMQAVSGKDYMLPYIKIHLSRCCSYKGTRDQLKSRLAREFDSRVEPYFARRLRELAA